MMKEIKIAIKQHCSNDDDWNLKWYDQLFYTVKYIICRVFHLWQKEDYPDTIYVAFYNNKSYYSEDCSNAFSWEYLTVGLGYFHGWFCGEGWDTNC